MAVVNGEQVTRTELGREAIRRYGEEVLESLVNRQLISDACAQKGIQVTDAEISTEVDKVAGRFGLARDRWLQLLRETRLQRGTISSRSFVANAGIAPACLQRDRSHRQRHEEGNRFRSCG